MSRHLISIEIQRETAELILEHYRTFHAENGPITRELVAAIELALGKDDG